MVEYSSGLKVAQKVRSYYILHRDFPTFGELRKIKKQKLSLLNLLQKHWDINTCKPSLLIAIRQDNNCGWFFFFSFGSSQILEKWQLRTRTEAAKKDSQWGKIESKILEAGGSIIQVDFFLVYTVFLCAWTFGRQHQVVDFTHYSSQTMVQYALQRRNTPHILILWRQML